MNNNKAEYYRANRDHILARQKRYNEANRERIKDYQHDYYLRRFPERRRNHQIKTDSVIKIKGATMLEC